MFIKILTPNHNGKIELTTKDLEALIQEAVDKAIAEDRMNRPIQFWYGNAGEGNQINTTPNWDWTKVTCNGKTAGKVTLFDSNDSKNSDITFMKLTNEIIGESK